MNVRRSLRAMSFMASWAFFLAGVPVLAPGLTAQGQIHLGDPVWKGNITSSNQTDRFVLMDGKKGDTLRIAFCSQSNSWNYFHRLDVWEGQNLIGTIDGRGVLTVSLKRTTYYMITVRARDNKYLGWYGFQLNRLNNPVGADRIAFNWNMKGSISAPAMFSVHTLRAVAGSAGLLRFTSQSNSWNFFHYAEIVDSHGKKVAKVDGNGTKAVKFTATGVYTLFVAARNYQYAGWYAVSVDCQSWPATPCDCSAHSSNYGKGWPGTRGVPSLTANTPKLGTVLNVQVGNSYGKQTPAFLLVGIGADKARLSKYGGTLLVASPFTIVSLALPPGGRNLPILIPNDPYLCGIGASMQAVLHDPGAKPAKLAFSRGLLVLLGR